MGFLCCFNSPDKDETVPLPPRIRSTTSTEKVEWLSDRSWDSQLSIANDGTVSKEMTMQQRARTYINSLYPQCARVGSIENIGKTRARLRDGTCSPYTHDLIVVLDDDFTGVVYTAAIVLDLPDGADLTPGKWLKTPEMEEAQFYVLQMIEQLQSTKTNVRHAIARIFIGSDAVYCKLHPENVEPTVTVLDSEPRPGFKEFNNEMARAIHQLSNVPQGAFRSFSFEYALNELYERYPGCTVWDEGPLDFKVGSKLFAEPTRLLVARLFQGKPDKHFQPDEDVDATVYRVIKVGSPASGALPPKLLQNRNHQSFPGGIVAITLFVATPLSALWFKTGAYAKSAPLKAAKVAAQALLSKWNREGKLQCCHLTVAMGADFARFKFVGEDFSSKKNQDETSSALAQTYPSLDPFFIELKGEDEHELFQSEVQFQSIKQLMRERAQQDPERFRAMAPTLAVMSAQRFLETNYPNSVFVDEGEFPVLRDGVTTTISNTRLVLAKDPTKETNNVVAAMYLVPLPGNENTSWLEICDKAWIGTAEMNAAEQSLRTILIQWFKENKLADDCMAQVVMGIDATIYRFVDGERFEDYPEERQKEFKWQ